MDVREREREREMRERERDLQYLEKPKKLTNV